MKIIYESKKPKFAIGKDRYQWILYRTHEKRGDWGEPTYHPNLCNLLDELAENVFKKNTKILKELKDLDQIVEKVYALNEEVAENLEKILPTVSGTLF